MTDEQAKPESSGAEEEPKAEEPQAEEPQAEEPKAEEPQAAEPQAEEPQAEEPKAGDVIKHEHLPDHDEHHVPGTVALTFIFLLCFAIYFFANWMALADVWHVR